MKLDDDIHNYYEHLVLDRIETLGLNKSKKSKNEDYLADLGIGKIKRHFS